MKRDLIELSNKVEFSSAIVSDSAWNYSQNEDLRYLFWMTNLQKWLRECHNIHVEIGFAPLQKLWTSYVYFTDDDGKFQFESEWMNKYEQAFEVGLLEAIKLIK